MKSVASDAAAMIGRARRAPRRTPECGFTVLELLITVAVLSMLMALLVPAIQAARESARNLQCLDHLHEIGVALHSYHGLRGDLPAGWHTEGRRETAFGWVPAILPNLEASNLYGNIDFSGPITSVDLSVRTTTPATLLCPSDPAEPTFDLFAETGDHETHAQESQCVLATLPQANYVGVFGTMDPDDVPGRTGDGTFVEEIGHRFADLTRGMSHVVMVGERTARKLPSTWLGIILEGEDAAGRIVGHADLGPNRDDADECEFASRHPGHVNFLWADGRVEAVSDDIDRLIYQESARRD